MHFNNYFKNEFASNFKEVYKLSPHILGKVAIICVPYHTVCWGSPPPPSDPPPPLIWEGLFINHEISFELTNVSKN